MDNRTFYYARVSSKDQNLDRQITAFKSLGADDRDIITDKESGKDFERAGYQALKNGMLRQGDTLVVKSLDRLSRNKRDIKKELEWFKENDIRVKIIDLPTTMICKCQRKSEPGAHEKVSHKRPRKSEPERSRIVDPVC